MEVAKVLSFESAMEAREGAEGEGSTGGASTSDLVLSAAVALCSLVARQVGDWNFTVCNLLIYDFSQ